MILTRYFFQYACIFVFYFIISTRISHCSNLTLQILHTNDIHARFDETDVNCGPCPQNFRNTNKCFGGFARIKTAALRAFDTAKKRNISSIFLNAGDTFQGTPYYTIYKWKIVASLFDTLGHNVTTLGNHEFDDGIDSVVNFIKNISTPIVVCNLNLTTEPRMKNLKNLHPSTVLTVNGVKIGVVGYLTPDTMNISTTENLKILPEIPYVRKEAKRLKSQGIDIIIGLGHSGIEADMKIAEQVEELSLIVGGHSHTFLYSPKDRKPSVETAIDTYPVIVTQKSGKKVPIVQAYAYTKYLGKLTVTFDNKGNVIEANGNPILLDSTVQKDPDVNEKVESWAKILRPKLQQVKGFTRVFQRKTEFQDGLFESNIGNLITDALVEMAVRKANASKFHRWTYAPVGIYQNGGIRGVFDPKKNDGAITLEDILTVLPFQDSQYVNEFLGSTLKQAMEQSVADYDAKKERNYLVFFLYFSGAKIVYDLSKPPGQRVVSAKILCSNCSMPAYEPLDETKTYSVVLNTYLMEGGDHFDVFKNRISKRKLNVSAADSLAAYLESREIVYNGLDGRIVVKGYGAASSIKVNFSILLLGCCFLLISSFSRLIFTC